MPDADRHDEGTWRPRAKFVFLAFALIGALLLIAEHRAHVLPWLPWLLLAACPLMHVFMHRGHGDHDHHGGRDGSDGGPKTGPGPGFPAPPGAGHTGSGGASHRRQGERS